MSAVSPYVMKGMPIASLGDNISFETSPKSLNNCRKFLFKERADEIFDVFPEITWMRKLRVPSTDLISITPYYSFKHFLLQSNFITISLCTYGELVNR